MRVKIARIAAVTTAIGVATLGMIPAAASTTPAPAPASVSTSHIVAPLAAPKRRKIVRCHQSTPLVDPDSRKIDESWQLTVWWDETDTPSGRPEARLSKGVPLYIHNKDKKRFIEWRQSDWFDLGAYRLYATSVLLPNHIGLINPGRTFGMGVSADGTSPSPWTTSVINVLGAFRAWIEHWEGSGDDYHHPFVRIVLASGSSEAAVTNWVAITPSADDGCGYIEGGL